MNCYIMGAGIVAHETCGVDDFFSKLCGAELFYAPLSGERWNNIAGFRTISGGEISLDLQALLREEAARTTSLGNGDICEMYACHAIRKALEQAGIFPAPSDLRIGLVIGTNFGNAHAIENVVRSISSDHSFEEPLENYLFGNMAQNLATAFGLSGSLSILSLSCASGVSVIAAARRMLLLGNHDAIVACGVDELDTYIFSGLHALRAMSGESIVRPWDKNRKGAIFAEGAAAVVLSATPSPEWSAARPLAIVRGCCQNNDAFHLSAPDTTASGITRLIEGAMKNASVSRDEIDMINLHGTGTVYNDRIETLALENVLGDRAYAIPATANKGALAHLMGAAGIAEVVATVMSLKTGIIPPTANMVEKDPELRLNIIVGEPQQANPKIALKNSFGFGGVNSCIVLEKYDA